MQKKLEIDREKVQKRQPPFLIFFQRFVPF